MSGMPVGERNGVHQEARLESRQLGTDVAHRDALGYRLLGAQGKHGGVALHAQ